jgi:uncharacterized phage infection (PIP) family protein YhgE
MSKETKTSRPDASGRTMEDAGRDFGQSADTALSEAKAAVADAAREAGDRATEAAETVREKAEELAEDGKAAGADQIEGFARAARTAADDLDKQSPHIAGYVRQAADGIEQAANSVRNRSVGEFVEMMGSFARTQPTAFFGSAVLAGFVMSRFVKSRADRPTQRPGSEPAVATPVREAERVDRRTEMPSMPPTFGEMPS